jgi:hypothetical protein
MHQWNAGVRGANHVPLSLAAILLNLPEQNSDVFLSRFNLNQET